MPSWLSLHVRYRCRHAGACCASRWPIPLERDRVPALAAAVAARRIAVPAGWLLPTAAAPEEIAGVLAVDGRGHCVFHGDGHCAVQTTLGHAALPVACQHFPRVCLIDDRGVFVTLSHFCPTAASLLFEEEGPVSVVEGPAPWPGHAVPEGLDARGAWPPLLTPRVLMDEESYGLWERAAIDLLAGARSEEWSAEAALARLRRRTQALASWTPDAGPLREAVRAACADEDEAPPDAPALDEDALGALFARVRGVVPAGVDWPAAPGEWAAVWRERIAPAWPRWAPVVRRFLAAHVFASWLAYQGRGLAAVARGADAALAVLAVELARVCQARGAGLERATLHEAIRQADLLLRHHVDRPALAAALSRP